MRIRLKTLILGILVVLLAAWPVAAFAYTYVFKIPIKVQNVGPNDVGRVFKDSTVSAQVLDASGNVIASRSVQYQFQNGDQTLTIQVDTNFPGVKYRVHLDGPPQLMDTSQSIRVREGTLP